MNHLCEDLIILILDFCDLRTSFYLALTNKYISQTTLKKGFAKHISYDSYDLASESTYDTFLRRFHTHQHTLRTCSMSNLNNPFLWLPKWVQKVYFFNCRIQQEINPSQVTETEVLYISSKSCDWEIHMNWDKFPKLREMTVINYRINFEEAQKKCPLLTKFFQRSHIF
jgi:hypothetical protein